MFIKVMILVFSSITLFYTLYKKRINNELTFFVAILQSQIATFQIVLNLLLLGTLLYLGACNLTKPQMNERMDGRTKRHLRIYRGNI